MEGLRYAKRKRTRDLTYSAWHRLRLIKGYVGMKHAWAIPMIDIDTPTLCEWDQRLETFVPVFVFSIWLLLDTPPTYMAAGRLRV